MQDQAKTNCHQHVISLERRDGGREGGREGVREWCVERELFKRRSCLCANSRGHFWRVKQPLEAEDDVHVHVCHIIVQTRQKDLPKLDLVQSSKYQNNGYGEDG